MSMRKTLERFNPVGRAEEQFTDGGDKMSTVEQAARAAKEAAYYLQTISLANRNMCLRKLKSRLKEKRNDILE